MAYRTIECTTWDDPWFAELSPKAKLVFLYLITNHRVTQCGAMVITFRQIEFETGITGDELPNLFYEMRDRVKLFLQHSTVFVRNFYRYQRANASDRFDIAARKAAQTFAVEVQEWVYGVYPHLRPNSDTLPIPSNESVDPTPTLPENDDTLPIGLTGVQREDQSRAEQIPAEPTKPESPPPPNGGEPPTVLKESRIPVDFEIDDDMIAWAEAKGFSRPQIDHHTETFCAFWRAKPGKDAKKLDWRLTWQVWMGKEQPGKWPGAQARPPVHANSNGRGCPYPVGTHAAEDWELLRMGMEPGWGSAKGGIDKL